MKYEDIKFFSERCEEHPDHQTGMVSHQMIQDRLSEEVDELRAYIESQLAQPEQEPVAYVDNVWINRPDLAMDLGIGQMFSRCQLSDHQIPLYTHPVKEQLTDGEINLLAKAYSTMEGELNAPAFARAILRRAQEK